MLVLSRKLQEAITLPTVHTTIRVLGIRRGVVRLGIAAPPDIAILRAELPHDTTEPQAGESGPAGRAANEAPPSRLFSQLCDQLQTTAVGLGLVRLHLDAGSVAEARTALVRLQDDFQLLRHGVVGEWESPPLKPPVSQRKPQRALLVEDDCNQRELLAGFLRLSGLNVDTAGDGSDALDYLGSHAKPDVILLDMVLPRVDGVTAVREIRRNPAYAGLKIFGVSGLPREEFDIERGPQGIDGWFQKPIDPVVLLDHLVEECNGSWCSA
jgi:carbon storage regulator CsrA